MRKLFASVVLLSAIPVLAQQTPKSIALTTDASNIPEISQALHKQKNCRSISVTSDASKSDFTLEATKHTPKEVGIGFDLTLFDREGVYFRGVSDADDVAGAVKELCGALQTELAIEVVDPENLTQSGDLRGNNTVDAHGNPTNGGLDAAVVGIVNATTGRRTHTDATTMAVIVNGEHALLDCYERAKGCVPIGPGRYYAELATDKKSLWVEHEVPISHIHVRDHYVIAGSW